MIRAYCNRIQAVPDFTSIHKRVNKLDIKIDETMDDHSENGIILAIDSTGIRVANRGEWMRQQWHLIQRISKNPCCCRCENKENIIIENN